MFGFKFYLKKNKVDDVNSPIYHEATGDFISIDLKSNVLKIYSNLDPKNPDELNLNDYFYVAINTYSYFDIKDFIDTYKEYIDSIKKIEGRSGFNANDLDEKMSILILFEQMHINQEKKIIDSQGLSPEKLKEKQELIKKKTKQRIKNFENKIITKNESQNNDNQNENIEKVGNSDESNN